MPVNRFALLSSLSFEFLVYLVIQEENSTDEVIRWAPPDYGIDLLRESDDGERFAYQCKHLITITKADVLRKTRDSLETALRFRDRTRWNKYILCFSQELPGPTYFALEEMIKGKGLSEEEYGIRMGSSLDASLSRPGRKWIWEAVNDPWRQLEYQRRSPGPVGYQDKKLREVLSKAKSNGTMKLLPRLLQHEGINIFHAWTDWYLMAVKYYSATKSILRGMSIEQEVTMFWLLERGKPYKDLNIRMISDGIVVRRIFVFDFGLATCAPDIFQTYVFYACKQSELGIKCRIIPRECISAYTTIACQQYGIQDDDNVAFLDPSGLHYTVYHDHATVQAAIEAYDEMFFNPVAKTPEELFHLR